MVALNALRHARVLWLLGASFLLAQLVGIVVAASFLPPGELAGRRTFKAPSLFEGPSLSDLDLERIHSGPLFSRAVQTPKAAVGSQLPLKLVGTIVGASSAASLAILERIGTGRVNSFFVGEDVGVGAKLVAVQREKVLVDHDGQLEYLIVEHGQPSSREGRSEKALGMASVGWRFSEPGIAVDHDRVSMSRAYRLHLLDDLPLILQQARAVPELVDGVVVGFRLAGVQEDSVFAKLGLKANDVIEEINGVPLIDVGKVVPFLNSLRDESDLSIRVQDGTGVRTMTIRVE